MRASTLHLDGILAVGDTRDLTAEWLKNLSRETVKCSAVQAPAASQKADDPFAPGQSLGYLVRDTFRAFTKALHERISSHGISVGQWFYLRVLWEEEGLSQRELGERVGVMQPTTVSMIQWMEDKGLIRRKQDPNDGRRMNIYLTVKGRRLREQLLPYAREVNELAAQGFSEEELATVRRLLHRLIANLEPESSAAESKP